MLHLGLWLLLVALLLLLIALLLLLIALLRRLLLVRVLLLRRPGLLRVVGLASGRRHRLGAELAVMLLLVRHVGLLLLDSQVG